MRIKRIVFALLTILSFSAFAVEPNFVEVYLMMAEPGGTLYSCAGHTALRLKCDTHNLDYCFSYESEPVTERVLTFLAGNLKMGMFAVPTDEYIGFYRADKRGIKEYPLNLPIEVKRRLWRIMDEKVAEGVKLPYDYLERGCAQSVLRCIMEAAKPLEIDFGKWPKNITECTRRELFCGSLDAFPWNRFFTQSLVGVEADRRVSNPRKVVIPADLLTVLRQAKLDGKCIITEEGKEVCKGEAITKASWFSPCVVGGVVVLMALLSGLRGIGKILSYILLGIYAIYGVFYTYLVFCSGLPATSWHWLVIPFNILPLVFWKWRKVWGKYFAGVLIVWMAAMALYPQLLIDPAYYLIVFAYVMWYNTFK